MPNFFELMIKCENFSLKSSSVGPLSARCLYVSKPVFPAFSVSNLSLKQGCFLKYATDPTGLSMMTFLRHLHIHRPPIHWDAKGGKQLWHVLRPACQRPFGVRSFLNTRRCVFKSDAATATVDH
jgi:hypothetical protein